MFKSLSIIIPTYNRPKSLERLLDKLNLQDYPLELWNVIIVDDGSGEQGYEDVVCKPYNFRYEYLKQVHKGAAAARNLGASSSQADILLFLDDDVVVEPHFIQAIVDGHNLHNKAVVMGSFQPPLSEQSHPFKKAQSRISRSIVNSDAIEVPFTECVSHNLSLKRKHFFELQQFQDPTFGNGWPNWDDIDLAYRAHKQGFSFLCATKALGSHIDYTSDDFNAFCMRSYRAGKSAVYLFEKYPGISIHLPMFKDKLPINMHMDPLPLILRKTIRWITSLNPIIFGLEKITFMLEKQSSNSAILYLLYRWINSSYIYKGYHQGLKVISTSKE